MLFFSLHGQETIIESSSEIYLASLVFPANCVVNSYSLLSLHNTYKTENLKHKLGKDIQFWQPNYKSELVYSSHGPKGQAVESAFDVAASDSRRL